MSYRKYFLDAGGERIWLPCEADALIEVFENHAYLFGVMSTDEDVWILIASALQRRGIEVTAKQAKRKWHSMRGTFDRISRAKCLKPLKLCSHLHSSDYTTRKLHYAELYDFYLDKKRLLKPSIYCTNLHHNCPSSCTLDDECYSSRKKLYNWHYDKYGKLPCSHLYCSDPLLCERNLLCLPSRYKYYDDLYLHNHPECNSYEHLSRMYDLSRY